MTVGWFGPSWEAPVNEPENEVAMPYQAECIRCGGPFYVGDQGLSIPASPSISPEGRVYYHRNCFMQEIGVA